MTLRFLPGEHEAVEAELSRIAQRSGGDAAPQRILAGYLMKTARHRRRRGVACTREDVARSLLDWSRRQGDAGLFARIPLSADLGEPAEAEAFEAFLDANLAPGRTKGEAG